MPPLQCSKLHHSMRGNAANSAKSLHFLGVNMEMIIIRSRSISPNIHHCIGEKIPYRRHLPSYGKISKNLKPLANDFLKSLKMEKRIYITFRRVSKRRWDVFLYSYKIERKFIYTLLWIQIEYDILRCSTITILVLKKLLPKALAKRSNFVGSKF